jgi:lipid-binding SYLF domain-containing protein
MIIRKKAAPKLFAAAVLTATSIIANYSFAGAAREEGRLLTATEVLDDVQSMPDQRLPDTLLAHAYGIAVIPDVTKIAFFFGGRHGNGVLTVRDTLNSPWSNPVFIALTGGSWGLQAGAQSSDIILVFTTKGGIEGITGGKLTLGADASVAAGPVGRQGSAAIDVSLAEIYSYARTRGLFGGIAVDGSVIAIDKSANADPLRQERGDRDRDLLGSGAGGAGDRAAIPRAIGAIDAHRGAHLARAASRPARCLLCRPGPAGGACGGSAAHVSAG